MPGRNNRESLLIPRFYIRIPSPAPSPRQHLRVLELIVDGVAASDRTSSQSVVIGSKDSVVITTERLTSSTYYQLWNKYLISALKLPQCLCQHSFLANESLTKDERKTGFESLGI